MKLKAGDTAPPFTADLNADITGASSVRLRIEQMTTGVDVLDRAMTVTNAATGLVSYQWVAPGDNAVINTPGAYLAEVVVTFAGGQIQRFPQGSHLEIWVRPAIGVPV